MSLVPAQHSFTIYQGATFFQRIFFEINNVLQDVSEYAAKMEIKDQAGGAALLTLDNAGNGGITLGGSAGTIDLTISAVKTSTLTWSQGIYELFITDKTARTDVLLRGGIKVIPF